MESAEVSSSEPFFKASNTKKRLSCQRKRIDQIASSLPVNLGLLLSALDQEPQFWRRLKQKLALQ